MMDLCGIVLPALVGLLLAVIAIKVLAGSKSEEEKYREQHPRSTQRTLSSTTLSDETKNKIWEAYSKAKSDAEQVRDAEETTEEGDNVVEGVGYARRAVGRILSYNEVDSDNSSPSWFTIADKIAGDITKVSIGADEDGNPNDFPEEIKKAFESKAIVTVELTFTDEDDDIAMELSEVISVEYIEDIIKNEYKKSFETAREILGAEMTNSDALVAATNKIFETTFEMKYGVQKMSVNEEVD
jgi:hypothetical protein